MSFIIRLAALLLCFMTVSGSQLSNLTERELTDVYIDSLAMTIPLPEDACITDRTVSADYPPLEYFGMTASQLEVELKKGNIYCTALWFPEENDMTEIIVTMTEDDDSRAIFHLRDYDGAYLDSLADSYANYSEHGLSVHAMYTDAQVVRTTQAAYIKAHGVRLSDEAAENHLHYMTVVNGKRVEITLVEHYTRGENDADRPTTVSAANEQLMNEIIGQISFDGLDNEFVSKNRSFIFGCVIVSVLSAGLIAAYFVSKYRVWMAQKETAVSVAIPETNPVAVSDDPPGEER